MSVHIALFTNGYPYVDAALRAADLSRRHGARLSRSVGQPLSLKRDQFVRWFLGTDASHALFLEGDVVPPEDALERLLAAGAPIVTASYLQWIDGRFCANVQLPGDGTWSAAAPSTTFEVQRCLFGCVLVSREALTKIEAPWFLATMTASRFVNDDEWFCAAAARAGVPIVCDGSIVCAAFRQGTDLRVLATARQAS